MAHISAHTITTYAYNVLCRRDSFSERLFDGMQIQKSSIKSALQTVIGSQIKTPLHQQKGLPKLFPGHDTSF